MLLREPSDKERQRTYIGLPFYRLLKFYHLIVPWFEHVTDKIYKAFLSCSQKHLSSKILLQEILYSLSRLAWLLAHRSPTSPQKVRYVSAGPNWLQILSTLLSDWVHLPAMLMLISLNLFILP